MPTTGQALALVPTKNSLWFIHPSGRSPVFLRTGFQVLLFFSCERYLFPFVAVILSSVGLLFRSYSELVAGLRAS